VYFGAGYATISPNDRYFKGKLSGVEFWNTALTPAQVQTAMQPLAGNEAGLIGYWPLDEGLGSTVDDKTTGAHDGTLGAGLPTWSRSNAVAINIQGGSFTGSGTVSADLTNAG